jgi:hypothetical protein
MFSKYDFESSLKKGGFGDDEIRNLESWLSENWEQIRKMDVGQFAHALRERGVSAVSDNRTPERWEGALQRSDAAWHGRLRHGVFATMGP